MLSRFPYKVSDLGSPRDPNELEVCGTREALAILGSARKSAAMGRLRKTRLTEQCKEETMGWWFNWYFRLFKYLIIFYLIYQGFNSDGQIWLSHCQIVRIWPDEAPRSESHPRWILGCFLVGSCQSYPGEPFLVTSKVASKIMSMTASLKSKDLLGKLIECVQLRMTKAPRQELRVGSQ